MDKQIEEMANDLQEAWTAWGLSVDLPSPWTFVAEILAKKWQPKISECVVDYIENYKEGFKEGVVALKTQLKERCKELQDKYSHICKNKYEAMQESCRYEGVTEVKNSIDEICKELVDE